MVCETKSSAVIFLPLCVFLELLEAESQNPHFRLKRFSEETQVQLFFILVCILDITTNPSQLVFATVTTKVSFDPGNCFELLWARL